MKATRLIWQFLAFAAAVAVGTACVHGLVIGVGEGFRAGLERDR